MSLRVHFFKSDKPREWILADAVLRGAAAHGNVVSSSSLGEPYDMESFDVACVVGVKSRELFQEIRRSGAHTLYFDKGVSRHKREGGGTWQFWRVAIDAHQPTSRLHVECPPDRAEAVGWRPKKWRKDGEAIIVAGSSEKYHAFHGLGHPTKYARSIVTALSELTDRPIIYRPKPSWRAATPLKRGGYSRPPETLADLLGNAWALVTHGSNACFDAVMAGVPCIILGDAVAKPISSTDLAAVNDPMMVDHKTRMRWLASLAYFQWTESEFASGEAWAFIGQHIHG